MDLSGDGREHVITIAAGPVIIENEKVLLVQHGAEGLWKFPGGKVRDGESFGEAASRELNEELCVSVKLVGDPCIFRFKRELEGGLMEEILLFHYFAERLNDVFKPGKGIEDWAWHDVDKLPENCHPNVAPAVAHFKNFKK
jgi:ADP-ribose pyrophosphatase YjhB (NUDIX family)